MRNTGSLFLQTCWRAGSAALGLAFLLGLVAIVGTSSAQAQDGKHPDSGVIMDAKGNLYGTTSYGGDFNCTPPNGCGTVFKLDTTGKETVLHSFNGTDGRGLKQV